jgi:hypothetical protein
MNKFAGVSILISIIFATTLAFAKDFPIDTSLGAVESKYTDVILKLVKNWPPKDIPSKEELGDKDSKNKKVTSVIVKAFETPGNGLYIGMLQVLWIHAKLEAVESVIDDFKNYQNLFVDFKDIHVASSENNKILTSWEQYSPVFLAPNVRYQMIYLINKISPKKKIYRYGLKESNYLKVSDGVIVIEETAPGVTRLVEYDFFDSDWGLAKAFGTKKIWMESLRGNVLTDIAIKLKAENPDWGYKKIHNVADDLADELPLKETYETKKPWQAL